MTATDPSHIIGLDGAV